MERITVNPFESDELHTLVSLAGSNVAQLRVCASAVLSNVCLDEKVQSVLMGVPDFMKVIKGLISCTDHSGRCKIHAFTIISIIAERTAPIEMKDAFLDTAIDVISGARKEQRTLLITGTRAIMWMLVYAGSSVPLIGENKLSLLLNLYKQENPSLVSFVSASVWALSKNKSNVETLIGLNVVDVVTNWVAVLLSFGINVETVENVKQQTPLEIQIRAMGSSATICMLELLLGVLLSLSHYASSHVAIVQSEGIDLLIHMLTMHDYMYTHSKKIALMVLWTLLDSPEIAIHAMGLKLVEVLVSVSLDLDTNPPEIRLLSAKLILYLEGADFVKSDSRSAEIMTRNFENEQNIEAIMISLVASEDCSEGQIFGV
jgi:hypothetical protein